MKTAQALSLFLLTFVSNALSADHQWNFDDPGDRFGNSGPGGNAGATLTYFDPNGTGWGPTTTSFGSASSFNLPPLPGGEAQVMSFPACLSDQGYSLSHDGTPNGVFGNEGRVSNYTIVADVLYPAGSAGQFRPLYQTTPDNSNDAEIYIGTEDGIGISGRYTGLIRPDTWHRVVIVVRSAPGEGQLHKYIDGTFVGGQGTTGSGIDERWSISGDLQLFTDDNGETAPGYVSSIRFIDRNLTMAEVMALGKATSAGTGVAGPAPDPFPYQLPREVDIIAHRGESCCAPEDTLSALGLAYDEGADYCEVDVRLSGDGVAVLMHDATVDRTTDGTGAVTSFTATQLAELDAGSWFSDEFVGEPVPTLEQAYCLAKSKGGKLYLDIKVTGMENAIKQALDNAGVAVADTWMWVYSNPSTASALRNLMPGAKIIWGEPGSAWELDPEFWNSMRAMGVFGFDLGAGNGDIDADFVRAARAEGFYISNYTLLDPDALINAVAHGAMGLETDFVAITEMMMPPYDIIFTVPADIETGTPLGAAQLNATSSIAGTFTYDPPAGTILPPGTSTLLATFTPDDLATYPVRTVSVPFQVRAGEVLFSTDKEVYQYDEDIVASWQDGPGNPTDWIGIYPTGTIPDGDPGSTLWFYVNNTRTADVGIPTGSVTFSFPQLPLGEWDVFLLDNDGYNLLAGPITITVAGPGISFFGSDSMTFATDDPVTLRWLIEDNESSIESLTLSDGFETTDVLGRSSLTLPAPTFATTYILTLNGDQSAETAVFPINTTGASIEIPKNIVLPGEGLEVAFAGGPGNPTDWIGIYRAGVIPDGDPVSSRFLYVGGTNAVGAGLSEGTVTFDLGGNPLPDGEYAVFFFAEDGYERIADPLRLTIGEPAVPPVKFEILSFQYRPAGIDLTWTSQAGRDYQVFSSIDLTTWNPIGSSITAEGSEAGLTLPVSLLGGATKLFFQVEETR